MELKDYLTENILKFGGWELTIQGANGMPSAMSESLVHGLGLPQPSLLTHTAGSSTGVPPKQDKHLWKHMYSDNFQEVQEKMYIANILSYSIASRVTRFKNLLSSHNGKVITTFCFFFIWKPKLTNFSPFLFSLSLKTLTRERKLWY